MKISQNFVAFLEYMNFTYMNNWNSFTKMKEIVYQLEFQRCAWIRFMFESWPRITFWMVLAQFQARWMFWLILAKPENEFQRDLFAPNLSWVQIKVEGFKLAWIENCKKSVKYLLILILIRRTIDMKIVIHISYLAPGLSCSPDPANNP